MKIHIVKHLKLYAYEIIKENKDKKNREHPDMCSR